MRCWLITSTTYGTWLPGDSRGSVTSVRDYRSGDSISGTRVEHARCGEAWEPPIAGLRRSATALMNGPAILLNRDQAVIVRDSFIASAEFRGWTLHAAAVMRNHFHAVMACRDETPSTNVQRDLKAYASRELNQKFDRPRSGTWWTASGSRRPLRGDEALHRAIEYVLHKQPNLLSVWPEPAQPR